MKRRWLLVLVFAIVTAGLVFAQNEDDDSNPISNSTSNVTPKNTITVDLGPTFIGGVLSGLGDAIGDEGVNSSGFGIGVQYERQIQEKLTVGGRFAYLSGSFGVTDSYLEYNNGKFEEYKTVLGVSLISFSLEGHVRYYPAGKTFFLDGMLGYAGFSSKFSGELFENVNGKKKVESVSFSAYRNYIKYGSKIGWRIDFGKPGGFIFEPSLGYYGGIGLGDTLGKQLADDSNGDVGDLDDMFNILEKAIFIGGPRISLSFGWRF